MRSFTVILTILLLSTACAVPAQPANNLPTVRATATDTPILDGTFQTSLLVSQWKGRAEGNILFPLDPASGNALPGYTPIPLGQTFFYSFSPDRQILAVVSFPNDSAYDGDLLLIHIPAWKAQRFEWKLDGWVSTMVFSPDGRQLAIAHGDTRYKLTLVDMAEGVIRAQGKVDSFISRLKFTKDSEALMLYHPTIDPADGLSGGPPEALLLDANDLTPRWTAELEEVHDGIFPKDEQVSRANFFEPGKAFYISPGLVFAPDRDALYIVHADSDRLTTVDFEGKTVKTIEVQSKRTWFDRLLSLDAGVARAKVGDGITRQAAISPDGQFLYVVGVNSATSMDQQGNWQMEQTPLGLEIIQARDGSRVEHVETKATELSLSPDGHFLYLRNWGSSQNSTPATEAFDTSEMQFTARKTGLSGMPAWLVNGGFLLVSTYSASETSHHMSILNPDGSRVLAEWTAPEFVWWLTTP